jgi:hypothetical protein
MMALKKLAQTNNDGTSRFAKRGPANDLSNSSSEINGKGKALKSRSNGPGKDIYDITSNVSDYNALSNEVAKKAYNPSTPLLGKSTTVSFSHRRRALDEDDSL